MQFHQTSSAPKDQVNPVRKALDRDKYSRAPKLLQKKAGPFVTSKLESLVRRAELRKALPSIRVRYGAAAIVTFYLLFVLNGNLIGTSSTSVRSLSSADEVRIFDTSGSKQDGRPVSIPRAFAQGEIPNFAEASIAGTPLLTQCDAKNRWPDGSLKFAIVSQRFGRCYFLEPEFGQQHCLFEPG